MNPSYKKKMTFPSAPTDLTLFMAAARNDSNTSWKKTLGDRFSGAENFAQLTDIRRQFFQEHMYG